MNPSSTSTLEAEILPTAADELLAGQREGNQWRSLGLVPQLAVGMALGSLVIAIAFAGARYGHAWAGTVFWLGQVIIYGLPACFLLLRRTVLRAEALAIAIFMPVTTYLVMTYYSPGQFRFLDEFQHVQTAQSILHTHHLFHPNTSLPISPQFPGLEIVTTCLATVTHFSLITSGLIVDGVAHVLVTVGLYFLVLEIWRNHRIAALAVVIYATESHYQFFDSYFIYQTIAIPFLVLALLATARMIRSKGRSSVAWGLVAISCGAVTAVSHHVTSYILIGMLLCFAIAELWRARPGKTGIVLLITLAISAVVVVWDTTVATDTFSYLKPVIQSFFNTAVSATNPQGKATAGGGAASLPSAPTAERIAEYIAIAILLLITCLGARRFWQARRTRVASAVFGMAIASLSVFAVLVLRATSSGGSELAGRALTFVLIPVSFAGALAITRQDWALDTYVEKVRNSKRTILGLAGTGLIVLLATGSIAGGWPVYYARLPGVFLVSGWERSIDQHNLGVAQWAADNLPPNGGVASDVTTEAILSSLGFQAQPTGISQLILSPRYSIADKRIVRTQRVEFVAIDRRIAEQLPASGNYFREANEKTYTRPVPLESIDKFRTIPGVSRIFDDGTIVIYDVSEAS